MGIHRDGEYPEPRVASEISEGGPSVPNLMLVVALLAASVVGPAIGYSYGKRDTVWKIEQAGLGDVWLQRHVEAREEFNRQLQRMTDHCERMNVR